MLSAGFKLPPMMFTNEEALALTIGNMKEEAQVYRGTASGFLVSARALVYMLIGHVDHHIASLHEKYLPIAVTL